MYHDQGTQPMRCPDSDKPLLLRLGMLGSGIVSDSGSAKIVVASSNDTACFLAF
jgi:hypothetical protein